jgi:pre-mRNA 3'-end-processing factor FIP1
MSLLLWHIARCHTALVAAVSLPRVTEAPWRLPAAVVTDYFNYGLNEWTWIDYQGKVAKYR